MGSGPDTASAKACRAQAIISGIFSRTWLEVPFTFGKRLPDLYANFVRQRFCQKCRHGHVESLKRPAVLINDHRPIVRLTVCKPEEDISVLVGPSRKQPWRVRVDIKRKFTWNPGRLVHAKAL